MIGVTKLLTGAQSFGDRLRYSEEARNQTWGTHGGRGPVVVWNITKQCNLACIHCYMDADPRRAQGELTTAEAKAVIDDLAAFRVPVILFSGGEPLIRQDIFELMAYAVDKGIRVTLSTNGTLITPEVAQRLKDLGVGYVGISLDGIGAINDRFRGRSGAFDAALRGIRNCLAVGQRVGLRFTLSQHNFESLPDIFDLIERENIPRACFYHLVYSGRGSAMLDQDVAHAQSRKAMDFIMEKVWEFHAKGLDKEILTVDNHADGVYIYLKVRERDPARAEQILRYLQINGGNRSGIAVANIDWLGNIHPDQFSMNHTVGNVREEPFSVVWKRGDHPILAGLRNRKPLLKGRCARCRWLDICNGNFRARAEGATGDFWAADPGCYLTDEEIGLVSAAAG